MRDWKEELYQAGMVPYVVIESIRKRHPGEAESILTRLSYHSLGGYWGFEWAGMFVGIEKDGYMHT